MLKVVVVADSAQNLRMLAQKLRDLPIKVLGTYLITEFNQSAMQKHQPDMVITDIDVIQAIKRPVNKNKQESRQHVTASTHQGVRIVPIQNIYYFQAEHKYVTVFHTQGQLLIEDSLSSLENEFAATFVRIHRKTLVAINRIEMLAKNSAGKYYIKLLDRNEELLVSRRQLSAVRKALCS